VPTVSGLLPLSRACCQHFEPVQPWRTKQQTPRKRRRPSSSSKKKRTSSSSSCRHAPGAASSAARLHALGSFAQSPFCLPPRGQHAHEFSVCTRPWCPRFRTCPLAWTAGPATAERDFCPLWSRRTVMCGSTRLSNGGHSAGRKRSARMMMMSFICS